MSVLAKTRCGVEPLRAHIGAEDPQVGRAVAERGVEEASEGGCGSVVTAVGPAG